MTAIKIGYAVTKLDRLARSVPDARDIVDELTTRGVPPEPWRLHP